MDQYLNLYRLSSKSYGQRSSDAIDTHHEMVSFQWEVKVSQSQWKHWNKMYHIGLLVMSAMTYLAPDFIKENRLCWLRSPLYIVNNRGSESYFFNDEEYNKVRGKIKGEVTRAKGLGQLSPETAHNSMFEEKNQRLEVIKYDPEAIDLLKQLMGENVEYRRDFIFSNVDFSTITE